MKKGATVRRRFETLEELTANIRDWDLDLGQLTPDETASELTQILFGPVALTHLEMGCGHTQRGASPGGAYSFALLADAAQSVRWCGYPFGMDCLALFGPGREFEAAIHPRFSVYTLTVDPSCLEGSPEWRLLQERMRRIGLPDRLLLASQGAAVARLRGLAVTAYRFSCSRLFRFAGERTLAELGYDMVAALLAVIGVATEARVSGTAEARARAIRKALTFIKDRPGEAIGLNRLCEVCRVSERTLQRAFLDHFGVTPKTYLLAFRLNQVRRELLSPGVPGLLIRDIAIGMGFWHMSQFARDYKRLFGELPSQTLANSRRESSSAEKDEPITATDTQADERG